MLTLNECRKLVDPKNENYTDKELEIMLSFHKELARIVVEEIKKQDDEKESSTNE
jgi:hypothetical protein